MARLMYGPTKCRECGTDYAGPEHCPTCGLSRDVYCRACNRLTSWETAVGSVAGARSLYGVCPECGGPCERRAQAPFDFSAGTLPFIIPQRGLAFPEVTPALQSSGPDKRLCPVCKSEMAWREPDDRAMNRGQGGIAGYYNGWYCPACQVLRIEAARVVQTRREHRRRLLRWLSIVVGVMVLLAGIVMGWQWLTGR